MKYTFHIVDVFSSTPFGGVQLAVLPDAAAISTEGMKKIAREFNFGGTTYRLSIQQGVSMGRPSEIEAEARKSGNVVTSISVGGATAYIASGEIEVPPSALVS
jgi:predicted PhzF superfamily epimerase YddE/YHI9